MHEERYKLREEELISLIQGKKLVFHVPDVYHIEIVAPNSCLTIAYQDWEVIKQFLMQINSPFNNMEGIIHKVENRK